VKGETIFFEEQSAFRKGTSCTDIVSLIKYRTERWRECNLQNRLLRAFIG